MSALSFYPRYTIRAARSAGDTPDMREACPMFLGFIAESFSRASMRIPCMDM